MSAKLFLSFLNTIRQQHTEGGVGFDIGRAAAELGTVCFPGFG